MKKVTILFIGALAALLSLAPVAGAKGKHHARTVKVCGIVDATSALPTTLVLATGGTRLVTIQNSTPVELTADIVPGADVCAKAKLVRTAPVAPAARHQEQRHQDEGARVREGAPGRDRAGPGSRDPRHGLGHRRDAHVRLPGRLHAVAEDDRGQGRQGHRLRRAS